MGWKFYVVFWGDNRGGYYLKVKLKTCWLNNNRRIFGYGLFVETVPCEIILYALSLYRFVREPPKFLIVLWPKIAIKILDLYLRHVRGDLLPA